MKTRHIEQHHHPADRDVYDLASAMPAWDYRAIFDESTDGMLIFGELRERRQTSIADVNPALAIMTGYRPDELFGADPLLLVAPEHRRLAARSAVGIRASLRSTVALTAARKDGSTFDAEISASAIKYRDAPHGLVVVRDISERVQAYRLLEQRVDERTRELATLLEVAQSVASTLELPALLGLVLDHLKVVVDHASSAIMIREGEEMVILEARDYRFADPRAGPVPTGFRFPVVHASQIWQELRIYLRTEHRLRCSPI